MQFFSINSTNDRRRQVVNVPDDSSKPRPTLLGKFSGLRTEFLNRLELEVEHVET
jgi:hypothetical protein